MLNDSLKNWRTTRRARRQTLKQAKQVKSPRAVIRARGRKGSSIVQFKSLPSLSFSTPSWHTFARYCSFNSCSRLRWLRSSSLSSSAHYHSFNSHSHTQCNALRLFPCHSFFISLSDSVCLRKKLICKTNNNSIHSQQQNESDWSEKVAKVKRSVIIPHRYHCP